MYNYQNITSPRNILKKWCKVELKYIKNDFYRRTVHSKIYVVRMPTNALFINLLAPELFFFNFSTSCIYNVNNTGTKQVRIMKQTAF